MCAVTEIIAMVLNFKLSMKIYMDQYIRMNCTCIETKA